MNQYYYYLLIKKLENKYLEEKYNNVTVKTIHSLAWEYVNRSGKFVSLGGLNLNYINHLIYLNHHTK